MSVEIHIVDSRLQGWLGQEPARQAEVLEAFREEGSLLVVGEMRFQVPYKTGFLRESISREFSPLGFTVFPAAKYGAVVNEGCAPHMIYPVNARALRFTLPNGGVVFAAHVHHPGFAGRRFVEKTAAAVGGRLRELVERVLERVYRA